MTDGTRVFATPAGVRLCPADMIVPGAARNFVLQMRSGRFHGFVVRLGAEEVAGYVDRCPHAGLPLTQTLDEYMTPDGTHIQCSWHGALFRPADGKCVGGPCVGQSLTAWPVAVQEDWIVTAGASPQPG